MEGTFQDNTKHPQSSKEPCGEQHGILFCNPRVKMKIASEKRNFEVEASRTLVALKKKASQVQLISSISEECSLEKSSKGSRVLKETILHKRQDVAYRAAKTVRALATKASQVELLSLLAQELHELELSCKKRCGNQRKVGKQDGTSYPSRAQNEDTNIGLHVSVLTINQYEVHIDHPLSLEDILAHLQEALSPRGEVQGKLF